jgi:hypothetical protein
MKMNTLYFVEIAGLKIRGKWFLENDRDDTRADVLETIKLYGDRVIKVLEVIEDEGTCRDVTADMKGEVSFANAMEAIDAVLSPAADRAAFAFDHARDTRKHEVVS